MSQLATERTKASFEKADFYAMYDNVSRRAFEVWISDIKEEIGWRKGKQVFPPAIAQKIIEHLGEPISLKVLNK